MYLPLRAAVLCALMGSLVACTSSTEARSARQSRQQVAKLQKRLVRLSEEVATPGAYSDEDVRAWIDAMPRSVIERMIPDEGYIDTKADRDSLQCQVADLYAQTTECARSFVRFLRAYRSSWGTGSSSFSSPEWAQVGQNMTVDFDMYELVFNSDDLKLTAVKYQTPGE